MQLPRPRFFTMYIDEIGSPGTPTPTIVPGKSEVSNTGSYVGPPQRLSACYGSVPVNQIGSNMTQLYPAMAPHSMLPTERLGGIDLHPDRDDRNNTGHNHTHRGRCSKIMSIISRFAKRAGCCHTIVCMVPLPVYKQT